VGFNPTVKAQKKNLWGEAVMTAAYLINRMPLRVLGNKSPIECLIGKLHFVVPPKVFGSVCFVRDHRASIGKLDPRSLKCIFVGYSGKQKGFKCWCPSERKMFISMDVTFWENEPYYRESDDLTELFSELTSEDASVPCNVTGGAGAGEFDQDRSREVVIGIVPATTMERSEDEDQMESNQNSEQGGRS
jgi:hypothetical protein